jgi:NAD(P)-dependent dehydrogenase (short-subunit alcohol dehydrogenase family)
MGKLDQRRVLVVGASKGIGKSIATRLCEEGARVAFAARTKDRLEEAVAAAGGDALPIECDVRDPLACAAVVEQAATAFGGLDALVYATGMTRFTELADADSDDWTMVLETNLVGAALVTRAALPHLRAAAGHAIYLSSNSASYGPPWRGIGLYITSKVALEKLTHCWGAENPEVRFTNHIVGPTISEFGADDPEGVGRFAPEWYAKGYIGDTILEPEVHAEAVVNVLTSAGRISSVMVVPH